MRTGTLCKDLYAGAHVQLLCATVCVQLHVQYVCSVWANVCTLSLVGMGCLNALILRYGVLLYLGFMLDQRAKAAWQYIYSYHLYYSYVFMVYMPHEREGKVKKINCTYLQTFVCILRLLFCAQWVYPVMYTSVSDSVWQKLFFDMLVFIPIV